MVVRCVFLFCFVMGFLVADSSDFSPLLFLFLYIFFLKENFTAPFCAPCFGPAGEGGSGDDWQCAQ